MKKLILVIILWSAGILQAASTVLVDAIPTAGVFVAVTPIGLPFKNAADEDPKRIEEGLNKAVSGILPIAAQRGFSYVCILSAPGEQPIEIPITGAKTNLKLSRTNTAVFALFYQDGHEAVHPVAYRVGKPDPKIPHVGTDFRKIAVPQGGNTAGWIYFNLSRIQTEAEKARSPVVFLETGGTGPVTALPIPGMKDPLMVPEEQSIFSASWYLSSEMAASRHFFPPELTFHELDNGVRDGNQNEMGRIGPPRSGDRL